MKRLIAYAPTTILLCEWAAFRLPINGAHRLSRTGRTDCHEWGTQIVTNGAQIVVNEAHRLSRMGRAGVAGKAGRTPGSYVSLSLLFRQSLQNQAVLPQFHFMHTCLLRATPSNPRTSSPGSAIHNSSNPRTSSPGSTIYDPSNPRTSSPGSAAFYQPTILRSNSHLAYAIHYYPYAAPQRQTRC